MDPFKRVNTFEVSSNSNFKCIHLSLTFLFNSAMDLISWSMKSSKSTWLRSTPTHVWSFQARSWPDWSQGWLKTPYASSLTRCSRLLRISVRKNTSCMIYVLITSTNWFLMKKWMALSLKRFGKRKLTLLVRKSILTLYWVVEIDEDELSDADVEGNQQKEGDWEI